MSPAAVRRARADLRPGGLTQGRAGPRRQHPSRRTIAMERKDTHTPATVTRRQFVKTAGLAAVVAGGIEGIVAARRTPAFAQGTKLHWVRWVDFIPESDVELKRQMPEASKAL